MRTAFGVGLVLSLGLFLFPALGFSWLLLLTIGGAALARRRGVSGPAFFRALDELAARGERAIVAAALVVMTLAVFLDVVWRTSHSVEGAAAWGFVVCLGFLSLMGGLTTRARNRSLGARVAAGVGAFVIIIVAIRLIHAAPHGFGWSQRLALVLLLWVGFLGASLASKWGRHIQMDAVRRVVPARFRRWFEVMAEVVSFSLLLFLTLLAHSYVSQNLRDWVLSEFRAAVFESLPIPYVAASLPIFIGFSLMLARSLRAFFEGPVKAELFESLGRNNGPLVLGEGAPRQDDGGHAP